VKFIISDGGLDEIIGDAVPEVIPEVPQPESGQA
jgi:hypothetical protein